MQRKIKPPQRFGETHCCVERASGSSDPAHHNVLGARTGDPEVITQNQERQLACRSNIFRLQTAIDLQYDPIQEAITNTPYRDAVCDLCEKTVSLALTVPLISMQARTRCSAEIALARQIAMYLCHTTFSLLLTEVGLHFGRDRSTVAHACSLVEDKRDDLSFDVMICQLEALLCDARHAMSICVEYEDKNSGKSHEENLRLDCSTPRLPIKGGV